MKTARQKRASNARYRSKFKKAVRKGANNQNVSEAGLPINVKPQEEE